MMAEVTLLTTSYRARTKPLRLKDQLTSHLNQAAAALLT